MVAPWREYLSLPTVWLWGALLLLVWVVHRIRSRIARRRLHRKAEQARAQILARGSFVIPGRRPGKHRKWRIEKPRGHGYYHAP